MGIKEILMHGINNDVILAISETVIQFWIYYNILTISAITKDENIFGKTQTCLDRVSIVT